jgi:hypothetical protein
VLRPIFISLLIATTTTATTSLGAPAPPASAPQPPANASPVALGRAGAATLEKLRTTAAASWASKIRIAQGAEVTVSVVHAPNMRRTSITLPIGGENYELARIIERDGLWFVRTENGTAKYRPYESPFAVPVVTMLREASGLSVADASGSPDSFGVFRGMDGAIARYAIPLPAAQREQIANMMAELSRMVAEGAATAEQQREFNEKRAELQQTIDQGLPRAIDSNTGVIVSTQTPQLSIEVQDFRWLAAVPQAEFDVGGGVEWRDQTADIITAAGNDTSELVMFGYNGVWKPGAKEDLDGVLLDMKSGAMRRIPFIGPYCQPGCFLPPDRTRIVAGGFSIVDGAIGIYLIDLKTGENRRLGADAGGMMLMPAASPDGKTIAVLHKEPMDKLLEARICLIDVESGKSRALGDAADQAFISWLRDGSGLLVMRRSYDKGLREDATETICRLAFDGTATPIRPGNSPIALLDGESILYRGVDRMWYTCDLAGENERKLGDGLSQYTFPTPAPDRKRLMMMRIGSGTPAIVNLADGSTQPVGVGPGLWSLPRW